MSPIKSFVVYADSVEEKNKWVEALVQRSNLNLGK